MSAVTCSTTTTTTALPYATRKRDNFLRMSTTAHTRWIIRDPRAARAAYVTWHGPQGEILGTAEAPRTSLAPSYSMPPAIRVSFQRAYQQSVEASTPLRPPRREHEEDPLNSSSDGEPFFTPTMGRSRFEPYPATDKKRKPETAVRAAIDELERLREPQAAPRTAKKPRVVSNVRVPQSERAAYAPFDPYRAPLDPYTAPLEPYAVQRDAPIEPPRAAYVKRSMSFVPQVAPVAAPRQERTRGSGLRTPLQRQIFDASTQTDSSKDSHWQPRNVVVK